MPIQISFKVIDEIISRQTAIYDFVFFYGKRELIQPVLEFVEVKYRERHPHSRVIRTDAARFRKETYQNLFDGIQHMPECDLYIFENIEEIAGLETNEQRLYGVLDWLLENGRQIIISGASSVAAMDILSSRIRTQIEGGISLGVE